MTTYRWLALLLALIGLPTQAQVDYAKVSADLNTTALKPGSYTDVMVQAFVKTDVVAAGLLALGQHVELQWQLPAQ